MTVVATVTDKDTAGIKLKSSVMTVKEGGDAVEGTVERLESKPTSDVVVTLSSDDCPNKLKINPTELTITPNNWRDIQKTFTVSALTGIASSSCKVNLRASGPHEYSKTTSNVIIAITKTKTISINK